MEERRRVANGWQLVEYIRTHVDERHGSFCYACGDRPTTRDHGPAKVFLDQPYPENLPVVFSCRQCNEGASLDEEYVASALEIAACGTTDPSRLARARISRGLIDKPSLAARLANASVDDGAGIAIERERLARVLDKTGRALCTYETGEPAFTMRADVAFAPLEALAANELEDFLQVPVPQILPEVGSRMMYRVLVVRGQPSFDAWQDVQSGRFSYALDVRGRETVVKMLVRGFLAVEVLLADKAPDGRPRRWRACS